MEIEYRAEGIHLPEIGLWLDPAAGVEAAWMSHGHGDHARGLHGRVWATPETLEFYTIRWPDAAGRPQQPVCYGQPFECGGARCTPLPAAHILGAAQLLIEYGGERLLYTGDIKGRAPLCGSVTEVVACDRLIVECTFGLPIYHFLEREQARARIVSFARECLAGGSTPVFYGYALGRGQEIVHALTGAGIATAVHGAIARFLPAYERAGYSCEGWEPYDMRRVRGKALVVLPGMRNVIEASGRNFRVAYVSGWAALANARARVGAEELIPYSDHGDFGELMRLVEASGARQVDLVHGYTEAFARILQQRGVRARAPQALASRSAGEDPAL